MCGRAYHFAADKILAVPIAREKSRKLHDDIYHYSSFSAVTLLALNDGISRRSNDICLSFVSEIRQRRIDGAGLRAPVRGER